MSNSAYNEGYERGLKGKDSASWGQVFGDSTVNPAGSSEARRQGNRDGRAARAFIKAQNNSRQEQ